MKTKDTEQYSMSVPCISSKNIIHIILLTPPGQARLNPQHEGAMRRTLKLEVRRKAG